MSFEINPVLAGKFDVADNTPAANYAQATNNIQTSDVSSSSDVSGPDTRRYTKFDRSDTEAGSTTSFSFSDLMDTLNPLEHIPVISSVYRAIVGEDINPVARVAGDILYGGALGLGSAVLGGASAVADAGLEEQTGKDSGGLALAALFGPDDKKDNVQLANAGTSAGTAAAGVAAPAPVASASSVTKNIELSQSATGTPLLAALAVPGGGNPVPAFAATAATTVTPAPNVDAAPVAAVNPAPAAETLPPAVPAQAPAPAPTAAPIPAVTQNTPPAGLALASANAAAANPASLGAIPLAKTTASPGGKQPFGGVMSNGNLQAQDMAMALAQGAPSMRMGHMIYTNKLVNGPHPLPPMLTNGGNAPAAIIAPKPVMPPNFTPVSTLGPSAAAQIGGTQNLAAAGGNLAPAQQNTAMSAAMMQDMMMKAVSQYGSIAAGPHLGAGSTVNLMN